MNKDTAILYDINWFINKLLLNGFVCSYFHRRSIDDDNLETINRVFIQPNWFGTFTVIIDWVSDDIFHLRLKFTGLHGADKDKSLYVVAVSGGVNLMTLSQKIYKEIDRKAHQEIHGDSYESTVVSNGGIKRGELGVIVARPSNGHPEEENNS